MIAPVDERLSALTEKEKQTLRLIVRGHDAKSTARSLGLSVHTINERLRDARRKLAVSSSREAARLLLDAEGRGGAAHPDLLADDRIGGDPGGPDADQGTAPVGGARPAAHRPAIFIGVVLMTLVLGLFALAALPQVAAPPPAATAVAPSEVSDAARRWLVLVDEGRWDESYRMTGAAFRKLNTPQVWVTVSEKVRVPLGKMISRTLLSQENLPAPPDGYEVVKFSTSFANEADAVETVTLEREAGGWRVVGVTIG
ncbi:DUF4019 domain-containing protein [Sphingomonas sp. KR1UV-12]|uniref:DUF4019 domain-containing protein n=1 Tax=Sphingomonas aurea TaxID=3063994 RepID=A0ABT9ELD2_9SPHN|nr:DUF4019 domain-containing protein [Sphingomonas sp. KR1UV-12]MDP1027601.1 DUF4019 domain-containing protein [Sphingomonas sp. KR1UV-12]